MMVNKMNKLLFAVLIAMYSSAQATEEFKAPLMCEVEVCNKLERFSLDIWSHMKDAMGETCFVTVLPKDMSVQGKTLSSESRWWQGSTINITKQSVTRVKKVIRCEEETSTDIGEDDNNE